MDIVVPQVGESIFEATVAKWHVADGSQVNKDDLLCELETDKISLELNAEKGGVIHLKAKEGETVEIGAVIATLDESASAGGESAPKQEEKEQKEKPAEEKGAEKPPKEGKSAEKPKQKAEPAAGEEPADKSAKGESAEMKQKAEPAEGQPAQPRAEEARPKEPAEPKRKDDPRSRRVAMSSIRKKIAAHLLAARQQTAMLTTFNEADLTRIQELRKKHQDKFQKKHEVKLGLMSFFVRACVEALRDHAEVNARIDGDDIVYQDFYDIGIAIGGEKGLVVPVLRDADELDYAGIEKAIREYGEKVQKNKLELADLEGGTFTISNGGVYGSMLSTPILNPPQCAVLGMHAIQQRPVVASGKVVVRPMMYLALSYDHRLIDGRQAVGFLKQIKEFIENPDEKLLNL